MKTYSPAISNVSTLNNLPVLHEVYLRDMSGHKKQPGHEFLDQLSDWDQEFKPSSDKGLTPSLGVEIVSQDSFDYYDSKQPYGLHPGECEEGMFYSERNWLAAEISSVLTGLGLTEDSSCCGEADFVFGVKTGFRRSETFVLYTVAAYERFREIVLAVQGILCQLRNDWIIYFQSLLDEGPDCEEIPEDTEDFIVWVYPNKIVATKESAEIVNKLINW